MFWYETYSSGNISYRFEWIVLWRSQVCKAGKAKLPIHCFSNTLQTVKQHFWVVETQRMLQKFSDKFQNYLYSIKRSQTWWSLPSVDSSRLWLDIYSQLLPISFSIMSNKIEFRKSINNLVERKMESSNSNISVSNISHTKMYSAVRECEKGIPNLNLPKKKRPTLSTELGANEVQKKKFLCLPGN